MKEYKDVVSLGKRLVEELGLSDEADTLGRWMAHYIAELIEAAERASGAKERSQAQRECVDVILRLWEHRSSLPGHAQPLAGLKPALDVLHQLRAGRPEFPSVNEGAPWSQFIREIASTYHQCVSIVLLAAAADTDLPREKRWLEEHTEMLSEEERMIIGTFDSWLALQRHWSMDRVPSSSELAPEEHAETLSALQDLLERQFQALGRLKERLQTGRGQ